VDNPVHNRFLAIESSSSINRLYSTAAFLTTLQGAQGQERRGSLRPDHRALPACAAV